MSGRVRSANGPPGPASTLSPTLAAAVSAGLLYPLFAIAAAALSATPGLYGPPTLFAFLALLALAVPFAIATFIERIRREKAVAEASEQRFRAMMDGAAIGMGLLDTSGRWVAANRSLTAMLGVREDELFGLGLVDFVHADDRAAAITAAEPLLRGEVDTLRSERRLRRADGSVVWALLATSAVRDRTSGAVLYLISQVEDITARKEAEAALAESEGRWSFALEGAGHGVWDVNLATGKAFHSPKWRAMLGYDAEAYDDGQPFWLDLVHPDDRDRVLALEADFEAGRTDVFECEFRVRHRDGRYIWVLDQGRVVARDENGRALRKIGTFTDITEKRRQADAIAASESRWNFALESARQGVWDFDVKARTSYYSPMWKALLGYSDEEIGVDGSGYWLSLIHPDDLPAVIDADERHLRGESDHFECAFRMAHKDGHWVWILDRGKVIERDADGAPVRMIGTHTDISRQKQDEQEIRRLSHRLQLAAAAGRIGLWEFDIDARKLWWDEGMFRLFGAPYQAGRAEEAYRRAVDAETQTRIDDAVRAAVATGKSATADFRLTLPSGEARHIRMVADVVAYPGEARRYVVGINWDVTEHYRLTGALSEEKERLRVTLESIGDAVVCTDTGGRITFANPAAAADTGWGQEEMLGRPVGEVFPMTDEAGGEAAADPVAECLRTLERVSHPGMVLAARDGSRRDIRITVTPVRAARGEVIGTVLVFQDITSVRQVQRQLAYSAAHDALTGLLNRASFEREIAAACGEGGERHTLFFIDLDHFKEVNDTGGHAAGDALLPEIARLIRSSVRSQDVSARIGGDEFGLLLRDCPLPQAEIIARKLISSIGELGFAHEGRSFLVGASIGIRQIPSGAAPTEVLKESDRACYEAKSQGGNRACVYGRRGDRHVTALAS